jgi:hypothetical protein
MEKIVFRKHRRKEQFLFKIVNNSINAGTHYRKHQKDEFH